MQGLPIARLTLILGMVFNSGMVSNSGVRDLGAAGILARAACIFLARAAGIFLAASAVLAVVAGCSGSSPENTSADGRKVIGVVAAENFWGDIITQIGGSHVKVTAIISDPNADPHEYESDARDAAAIAEAQFVLENGLGYDDFMDKLLSASPSSSRDVLSVEKILSVRGADPNPHIWYDTARLPQVAAAIVGELSKLDPSGAADFEANGQTFDASLAPITNVISEIKSRYSGDLIAYTERVPGYLVDAAGLRLGVPGTFAQAVEDGNDPSPADSAAFDSAITRKLVRCCSTTGRSPTRRPTRSSGSRSTAVCRSSASPRRSRTATRTSRPGSCVRPIRSCKRWAADACAGGGHTAAS